VAVRQNGILKEASILSLRCFAAVVETQSFSSAARRLRLSPSPVTKQVPSLEQALHVAPAHRTTRRISVTDAGERFYEQCLAILAQVDRVASVVAPDRGLTGHLRVAAPPSCAAVVLGPGIHELLDKHPGLSADVMVSSATPDLIRDRIDVAVTLQEEPQSKLAHFLLAAVSGTFTASTSRRTSMPGVWRWCCPVTRCGRRTSMPSSRAG
jgi:DNA-binding transcriptional LysR family regulator